MRSGPMPNYEELNPLEPTEEAPNVVDPLADFKALQLMRKQSQNDPDGTHTFDFLDTFEHNGRPLSIKSRLFIAHLLNSPKWDVEKAAELAGYDKPGAGHRLYNTKAVQTAIQKVVSKRMARLSVSGDRVLEELAKLAFANLSDVIDWDESGNVTMKGKDEVAPHALAAINEISQTKGPNGVTTKVKMEPKSTALNTLMKHLGMLTQKIDMNVNVTSTDTLTAARERVINARRQQHAKADSGHDEPEIVTTYSESTDEDRTTGSD